MIYNTDHLPPENEVLKTDLQNYIFLAQYANYLHEEQRYETWTESVSRAVDTLRLISKDRLIKEEYQELFDAIYLMQVFPSMRLFSQTQKGIMRNPETIFNCAAHPIDSFVAISELLWLSMMGAGAAFSVERRATNYLPILPAMFEDDDEIFVIEDSAEGWVDSLNRMFGSLSLGIVPNFDYSLIRPAGARLNTRNGIASGPQPLKDYHNAAVDIITNAAGRQLTTVEIYDLCTMIGTCAVSGGNRRSAMLCVFDADDEDMINVKSGDWIATHPHRSNANNSANVTNSDQKTISHIFNRMLTEGFGEPGFISNHKAFLDPKRAQFINEHTMVLRNPCAELIAVTELETAVGGGGGSTCNISSANFNETDTVDTARNKIRLATIIGTIQSSHTVGFDKVLRPKWKVIAERERLLGVSPTGVQDNPILFTPAFLEELRQITIDVNAEYASVLTIAPSVSTTFCKPAGSTSSLLGQASAGIHWNFGKYLFVNIRGNKQTELVQFISDTTYPVVDDPYNPDNVIITFPVETVGDTFVNDVSAKEQLENWEKFDKHYATQAVSCTINYSKDETPDLLDWLYRNHKSCTGISFFPRYDHSQAYTPKQLVTKQQYEEVLEYIPQIKWSAFTAEQSKTQSYGCDSQGCELKAYTFQ